MSKKLKKSLAAILVIFMMITAAPLEGFVGLEIPDPFSTKAEAADTVTMPNYCNYAAAEWAKQHLYDTWSLLEGRGYYDNGGDCANFVSQCIYMGGFDMENLWNYAGFLAHYGTASDGSWIRAHQLYEYVVSKGGISINNPQASQVSVGDLIFWKTTSDGRMHHSAIVTDIVNGVPKIAYHSTRYANGKEINETHTNWTLGYEGWRTFLVKMNGTTCQMNNPKNFDVYIAHSSSPFRATASTGAQLLKTVQYGDYIHVYQTTNNQGYTWGYCNYKGAWGWTNLGNFSYQRHITSPDVHHDFGDWFTAVKPTCISEGVSKHICKRCGYEETKTIAPAGHTPGAEPTCVTPQLCTVCGALLKDALGHDLTETLVMADCYNDAHLDGHCTRCDLPPYHSDPTTGSWSDWSPVSHKVKNPSKNQRTRVAYRWRQKDTKVTNTASEPGWTKTKSEWEQTGSGSKEYSTFNQHNDGGYNSYVQSTIQSHLSYDSAPYSAYENSNNKRVVSNNFVTFLYWHYCRGYRLNGNTQTRDSIGGEDGYDSEYTEFHYHWSNDDELTDALRTDRTFTKHTNTEILSTLSNRDINYDKATGKNYADSMMSVFDGTQTNSHLLSAIKRISAKGSTAANLGFEMAEKVFAQSKAADDENRQKIVVFITDGSPTSYRDFKTSVANSALKISKNLKDNGTKIYSIGIISKINPDTPLIKGIDGSNKCDNTNNQNKFLHFISSNYPNADSLNSSIDGREEDSNYYFAANDVKKLDVVFTSIKEDMSTTVSDFDNITLIDTISKNFTMTTQQEEELRENVISKFGVTNNDIIVTRNMDGTTTVELRNLNPTEKTVDGEKRFVVEVSFKVTANENAVKAGIYETNTEDAGVLLKDSDV